MALNYIPALKQFMERWDKDYVTPAKASSNFRVSELGNINVDGTAGCYIAETFAKADSNFKESIELGVRELVLLLIEKHNCITYSSCQGHPTSDDAPLRERHVGIIPRNESEYKRFLRRLRKAVKSTNPKTKDRSVRVKVLEQMLNSDDGKWPCIDIFFVSTDPENYFKDLDFVYDQFVANCR